MASDSDPTGGPQRERGDAHRGAGIRARFARHIREQARGTIGDLRLVNSGVPEFSQPSDRAQRSARGVRLRDLFFELLVPQLGGCFVDPLDVNDVTTLEVPAGYILSEVAKALLAI